MGFAFVGAPCGDADWLRRLWVAYSENKNRIVAFQ